MKSFSKKICFNFLGSYVLVESEWSALLNLLVKDFYVFNCDENHFKEDNLFQLKIIQAEAPEDLIPEIQTNMQTLSSLSYDLNKIRYNDYYGELTSQINFSKNEAVLYSQDLNKMHEVAYLIILSRVGKKLDLMGFHKLHALAISFKGAAVICMMPMKGGKSTLLMELLKDPRVKMISDDIPIVDRLGRVRPFPLKIGLDSLPGNLEITNPEENIYEMKRAHYGVKKLISVKGLGNKVERLDKVFEKVILIEAFRVNSNHSYLNTAPWFKTFRGLFKHGIIGFGLPMVIEYFWEYGLYDFFVKTFIFLSRFFSFFILSFKATNLRLHLGKKPEKAAKEILYFLEKTI